MPQFQSQFLRFLTTATVLSVLTITILLWWKDTDNAGKYIIKTPTKHTPPQTQSCSPTPDKPWIFDPARDANNHGLSEEQCRIAFPKLFVDIDQSANERWNRTITYKEVDTIDIGDGIVRAVVYNGEVRCLLLFFPSKQNRKANQCSYI